MKEYKLFIFKIAVVTIHVLYLAVFFGIIAVDERYIRNFSTLIQLGVCVFLSYRFFPYRSTEIHLTSFDVSIIFYCATLLLINVVATEVYVAFFQGTILGNYINSVKSIVPVL
jgi:hypothetical protein